MRDVELRSERLELLTTILLGVATAVGAWCTYQAQLWNSRQLQHFASGSTLQAASLRATEIGTRDSIVDVTTFAAVLQAESRGDQKTARYIVEAARPEFRGPLRAWVAQPAPLEAGGPRPFDDPTYRSSILDHPKKLQADSSRAFHEAAIDNRNSDLFVMRTVMIALSLFFFGIAGQLRTSAARRLAIGMGALILIVSVISLTLLPRAERPHLESQAPELPSAD
jgi:hypothetical protein